MFSVESEMKKIDTTTFINLPEGLKEMLNYWEDEINFCQIMKEEYSFDSSDFAYWKGKEQSWTEARNNLEATLKEIYEN